MTMLKTSADDALSLKLDRTFRARRERVFQAFTDAVHLQKWWGPPGTTISACELDPKPGGSWLTTMRAPDGSEMSVSGVYREVEAPSRLVFTWAWTQEDGSRGHETLVTLEFLDQGEATDLVLTQETFQDEDAMGKHEGGWQGCFDCLERALLEGDA